MYFALLLKIQSQFCALASELTLDHGANPFEDSNLFLIPLQLKLGYFTTAKSTYMYTYQLTGIVVDPYPGPRGFLVSY